jgi:hypothetical protein
MQSLMITRNVLLKGVRDLMEKRSINAQNCYTPLRVSLTGMQPGGKVSFVINVEAICE